MMLMTGQSEGTIALARALGLEPNEIRSITFRIAANEAAIVMIEKFIPVEQMKTAATIFKRYRLVEIEDDGDG